MSDRLGEPEAAAARGQAYRRLREDPQTAVQRLAGEIGPRSPTSLGEAKAAAYLDGRLRRAGALVAADSFRTIPPAPWDTLVVALVAVACLGLSPLLPLPSLLLALWGFLLASALLPRRAPLIGRRRASQNIVATVAAADGARRRVVVLAPLDTPPALGRLSRALLDGRRPAAGRLVASGLLAALALVGLALPELRQAAWPAQVAPVVYLALLAVLELRAVRAPGSPGGISHAGALAATLTTVEDVGQPSQVELWGAALGATATGAGLADALRRYPFERDSTLFIVLEGIGAGELCYDAPDPRRLGAAFAAAVAGSATHPQVDARRRAGLRPAALAAGVRAQGFDAITVTCLDASGRVPWRASADDTHERVDPELVERAARLVVGIVRRLDEGA